MGSSLCANALLCTVCLSPLWLLLLLLFKERQHLLVFLAMFVLTLYSPAICSWEDSVVPRLAPTHLRKAGNDCRRVLAG